MPEISCPIFKDPLKGRTYVNLVSDQGYISVSLWDNVGGQTDTITIPYKKGGEIIKKLFELNGQNADENTIMNKSMAIVSTLFKQLKGYTKNKQLEALIVKVNLAILRNI